MFHFVLKFCTCEKTRQCTQNTLVLNTSLNILCGAAPQVHFYHCKDKILQNRVFFQFKLIISQIYPDILHI